MYRFGFRRMKGSCMMHIIRDFCNTEHSSIVDLVFSEREVVKYSRSCSLYVVARPSLCLSVTFVRPSQAIEIFRNVSTPFLHCPSIHWQREPPLGEGVKRKRGAEYSDFWHIEGYISETVQWGRLS